ncbi:uncharacterized protein LOC121730730 [Aricia agestis]|uniref:uncharacterized protein LOC121730730 n=1 Tax=Aricia agestis TaxID=91739 RepID=UPI001C20AE72|nr:uncharacterized protein LOC121730730 [Aricia agestis]
MNPVASGDNLWLQGLPSLVPCCEGKELQIDEECIRCGLSAISVREEATPRRRAARAAAACCSDTTPSTQKALKARNSFRCVHRPELRRVAGLRHLSPADLRLALLQLAREDHTPLPGVESAVEAVEAASSASAREVPAGMRLHRARLFTAVLAAAARPQSTEDSSTADDAQDDESLTNERVQIILRPRTDEERAECRTTDTIPTSGPPVSL